MHMGNFDLDKAMQNPEEIIIDLWKYNDFEKGKKYQAILYEFPKRKELQKSGGTWYYYFRGEVINGKDIFKCISIEFSKINFDNAFMLCQEKEALKKNSNIKIFFRRSAKKLFISKMVGVPLC